MPDRWALPDLNAALRWCAQRNEQGMRCTMDILGRYYREEAEAERSYDSYLQLISVLSQRSMDASITVKTSTLGGTVNRDLTQRLVLDIGEVARNKGIGFELDMEGQRMVDLTLSLAERCAQSGMPVTIALQAYLRRTEHDVERMMNAGVKVRLVKGAYTGDISDFNMIAEVYKDLLELIISRDVPFCVATHDPDILEWATSRLKDKDIMGFGFLKGLADETKERMVLEGWKVSEYVPFGANKEGYEARRKTYLRKLEELGRQPAP